MSLFKNVIVAIFPIFGDCTYVATGYQKPGKYVSKISENQCFQFSDLAIAIQPAGDADEKFNMCAHLHLSSMHLKLV